MSPEVPTGALAIEQTAAQLAAYAWVEQRLFEILGGWALGDDCAPAAVLFDALSQQHAWHAELFSERVPLVAGVDGDARAPRAGLERALEALARSSPGAPRLAAMARVVLPRLVAGYRAHLAHTSPVADAPVVRALRLVLRDEVEGLLDCEQLLESLPAPRPESGALEAALAPATGVGVVGWPPPGVSPGN
ncbi:MAG: hypothetical protein ACYDA2_04635 [Acidimicrobiales bacterium]